MKYQISDINKLLNSHPDLFRGLSAENYRRFIDWLPDNLHIVEAFEQFSLILKRKAKYKQHSCYTIRERLRWESYIREDGASYKLDNSKTPFIARLLMKLNPELNGMFRTKNPAGYQSPEQLDLFEGTKS